MKAGMADPKRVPDRHLIRRWVECWRRAQKKLDELRRREIEAADTTQALRQLFGSPGFPADLPPRTTSGLVEQQAWFGKLRR